MRLLLSNFRRRLQPFLTDRQEHYVAAADVRLNPRMRTALGRAFLSENRIELNRRLLEKHPEELAPTLAHELAHLVAPLIYGRRGLSHGEGWQKIVRCLGFAPSRTHDLDVSEMKSRHAVKAWAVCACEGRRHAIYAQKLRKIRRRYRYLCLRCKQEIRITELAAPAEL